MSSKKDKWPVIDCREIFVNGIRYMVNVEEDEGLFVATSPNHRGLLVTKPEIDGIFAKAEAALAELQDAMSPVAGGGF